MEDRFVAEPMLGRLAKWLRTIGYDVVYLRSYEEENLIRFMAQGRKLLSRRTGAQVSHPEVILIRSDHVGEQLKEMRDLGCLKTDWSRFFTRCLLCNVPLKEADPEFAKSNVPDHIWHENPSAILFCPVCGRFFWPGTHKDRMLRQLASWGL